MIFHDIWALSKSNLDALSVERCALTRSEEGKWQLFLSYVGAVDGKWRIGILEADEPDEFDSNCIHPFLEPDALGVEGVKDPCIYQIGPFRYLLVSVAQLRENVSPETLQQAHAQGDIYRTGCIRSRTWAAFLLPGQSFVWLGDVSPAAAGGQEAGWDAYCRRITSLIPLDAGGFAAFYDGSATVEGNYEERTGLAFTTDLRQYTSLTPDSPALQSEHGSGALRYVDVLPVGHELFYYYEMARPDGSHDMRVSVVERT